MISTKNFIIRPLTTQDEIDTCITRHQHFAYFDYTEPTTHVQLFSVTDLGGLGVKFHISYEERYCHLEIQGVTKLKPSEPEYQEITKALSSIINIREHRVSLPLRSQEDQPESSLSNLKFRNESLEALLKSFDWKVSGLIHFSPNSLTVKFGETIFRINLSDSSMQIFNNEDKSFFVENEIKETDLLQLETLARELKKRDFFSVTNLSFYFDPSQGLA